LHGTSDIIHTFKGVVVGHRDGIQTFSQRRLDNLSGRNRFIAVAKRTRGVDMQVNSAQDSIFCCNQIPPGIIL